jgi:hypothetical protein
VKIGGIFSPIWDLKITYPKDYPIFLDWGGDSPDMTAIAAVHTLEGFVVGADGLRQIVNGPALDDQKLFSFESKDIHLGYAWCGTTFMWDETNPDTVLFDFRSATESILRSFDFTKNADFAGFVHNFREILTKRIEWSLNQNSGRNWLAKFDSDKIARVLWIGYFKGEPAVAEVKVGRIESELCVSVSHLVLPKTVSAFSGGECAGSEGDLEREPKDSEDARLLIHEFIKRCIDHPNCKGKYGGTVHIAKITPKDFTWMDFPKN